MTAVAQEIAEQARRRGHLVGWARGYRPSAGPDDPLFRHAHPAYHTLMEALTNAQSILTEDDFRELGELYDRPLWLIDRLARILATRAERKPLLIVIDDLQWADVATLSALRSLTRALHNTRVDWIFAGRSQHGSVMDAAGAISESAVLDLQLPDLDRSAIDQILDDRLGSVSPPPGVRAMIHGARGRAGLLVPFVERLRGYASTTPVSLIGHELLPPDFVTCLRQRAQDDLDDFELELVLNAAVLGRFTIENLARVVDRKPRVVATGLENARRGGYLCDDGQYLAFELELVRAALYASIPASTRTMIHHLAITMTSDGDSRLAEIAPHVAAVAEPGDHAAIDVLVRAATVCTEEGSDPAGAVQLLAQARRLTASDDPGRPQLAAALIHAQVQARQYDSAITESQSEVEDIRAARVFDVDSAGASVVAAAPAYWALGRYQDLAQAVDSVSLSCPRSPTQHRLSAIGAAAYLLAAEPGTATTILTRGSETDADMRDGDPVVRLWSLRGHASRAWLEGRVHDACRLFESAAQLDGPSPLDLMLTWVENGDLDRLREWCRELEQDSSASSDVLIRLGRAHLDLSLGDLTNTSRAANLAASIASRTDVPNLIGHIEALCEHLRVSGAEHSPAEEVDRPISNGWRDEDDGPEPVAGLVGGRHALNSCRALYLAGNHAAARQHLLVARAQHPLLMGFAENLVWAARISAPMSGEQSEVADGSGLTALASLLSEVLATTAARTSGAELVDGAVRLYVTGVLGGDPARLREAASAFVAAGRPLLAAIANEDLGRALYVQGARQQAAEPLEAAWKQYCDAGATVEADRARRFLRTAGVRRGRKPRASAPRATHGWDALTDAERRVAELIAEGLSNREAAQRLHVSPNTVATHLRSVYTKLGVTKRVHLARMEQPTSLNP